MEPPPPDWSTLPSDILEAVSKKITLASDYIRLRAVCTPWRSSLSPSPRHIPPLSLSPWLLLPYDPNSTDDSLRFFYDMSTFQIRRIHLPQTCGKQYCGSSKGWLVLQDQDAPHLSLFNPLTKLQLQLPSVNVPPVLPPAVESSDVDVDVWPSRYGYMQATDPILQRVMLTSTPSFSLSSGHHDCVVMALFKSNWGLAFCRIGDQSWTLFQAPHRSASRIIDATYHNGLFYCFSFDQVNIYDLKGKDHATCKVLKVIIPLEQADYHLVEGETDDLLLVAQHRAPHGLCKRDEFSIYKLRITDEEDEESGPDWIQTTTGIGKRVCFICEGIEQCFTLPVDALQLSALSENSVCYACPLIVEKNREEYWGWHPEDKFGYDIKILGLPLWEVPIFSDYWKDSVIHLVNKLGSYPTLYSRATWITTTFY